MTNIQKEFRKIPTCSHNAIGGKANVLWDKMYGSIALFAMYEVLSVKPSMEDMTELCTEAFIGNNRTMGKLIDFNWKWLQKLYAAMYVPVKNQADKHIADGSWGNTWRYEINPEGRIEGVNVRLCNCPVFDFAKSHGLEHLMPALCASDYKIFEPAHSGEFDTRFCNGRNRKDRRPDKHGSEGGVCPDYGIIPIEQNNKSAVSLLGMPHFS